MRLFMIFAVPLATFFAVVYLYKPEVLVTEYRQAIAPIERYFAEKRALAWQQAKNQAWKERAAKISLPSDCAKPRGAIRALECKSLWQLEVDAFDRAWVARVSNGWKPAGID